MNEMVERVARAFFDAMMEAMPPAQSPAGWATWEQAGDKNHEFYRGAARRAVEAMRKPIKAMKDAMFGDEDALAMWAFEDAWERMIDAMLK